MRRCNACNEVGGHHFEELLWNENIKNVLAIKIYENKTKNKKGLISKISTRGMLTSKATQSTPVSICLNLSLPDLLTTPEGL